MRYCGQIERQKYESKKNLDEFCRLYILLAFAIFYFPRTSRTVCTYLFYLLDNLEDLNVYNWGGAVLSMLMSSLDRCSYVLHQQRNLHGLYLCGCVPLLQVSAFDIGFIGNVIALYILLKKLYYSCNVLVCNSSGLFNIWGWAHLVHFHIFWDGLL